MPIPLLIAVTTGVVAYGVKKLVETDCRECGEGFFNGYSENYCSRYCYYARDRREEKRKLEELEALPLLLG